MCVENEFGIKISLLTYNDEFAVRHYIAKTMDIESDCIEFENFNYVISHERLCVSDEITVPIEFKKYLLKDNRFIVDDYGYKKFIKKECLVELRVVECQFTFQKKTSQCIEMSCVCEVSGEASGYKLNME